MKILSKGKAKTPQEGRNELIEAIGQIYDKMPEVDGIAISMPVFFGKGFSLFLLSCPLGFVIAFVTTMFLKFDADLSMEAQTK